MYDEVHYLHQYPACHRTRLCRPPIAVLVRARLLYLFGISRERKMPLALLQLPLLR